MNTNSPWHSLPIEDVFRALETDSRGLSDTKAARRLEQHGPNEVAESEKTNWAGILFHQLANPLVFILVLAAAVALLAGETIDTLVIAGVIILNTAIGFFQEYRAETAIRALRERAAPKAEVIRRCKDRDCADLSIPTAEVVPGDVIVFDTGDRIPADARIFEAAALEIDEAMLTGESLPSAKTTEPLEEYLPVADRVNLVYRGTVVTEGRGKAVVYATGSDTQMPVSGHRHPGVGAPARTGNPHPLLPDRPQHRAPRPGRLGPGSACLQHRVSR